MLSPSPPSQAPGMFVVSEADAAAIRTAFEQRGELSAAVELRRRFPGIVCSSCFGTRWWTKRGAPYGWCCGWCHPPNHLKPDQVRWEPAPEPTDGKPDGPRVQCLIRPPRM